ncbi:MAG: hypothetical protein JWQ38_3773 [Flavipsychrobacter sp.]|nr:hypothetical protein [Flavipsychrobacter sp.]
MQGTWKLAQTATDDNNNGAIEEEEKHVVPVAQDYRITFNKDYTGVEQDVYGGDTSIQLRFSWALSKDHLWVAYALHDTINYDLINLSANNLTLQHPTKSGIAWYSYDKR